ncbi:response regulator [Phytobacter massiliensis]|uniref:response regulator n=1 Tax=Phytobacter massiliensis TaxID=1485952 RepID=UPI00031AA7F4|nr:response regulator [Phytobacter massiliensis]
MTLSSRIVIIDDERSVRSGLSNLLQSEGYETDAFESAEAFLANETALADASLLIVDIRLKGMSGLELYRRVTQRAALPIILISGHEEESLPGYVQDIGPVILLRKPINIDTLLDHIRRQLYA